MNITAADFVGVVKTSESIDAAAMLPHIQAAKDLDVAEALGPALLEAIETLAAATLVEWSATLPALSVGGYVRRRKRIFRALVINPAEAVPTERLDADTEEWAYEPLLTLWYEYLKPYWVAAAYRRMIITHGVNVTKAGFTVPTDSMNGTFQPASAAALGGLRSGADSDESVRRGLLLAFLRCEPRLQQTTTCAVVHHRRPRFGFGS